MSSYFKINSLPRSSSTFKKNNIRDNKNDDFLRMFLENFAICSFGLNGW